MAGQSFSVITNISSLYAQSNLYTTNIGLQKTISRLSSGYRIVEAGDDAAGLAIANRLKAQVYALDQAYRNANDASGIIQIADGALSKITELLNRAVTLAEEASSGTLTDAERETLNVEYDQIKAEINRVFSTVNFKGVNLFNTSSTTAKTFEIFVGDTEIASTITISIGGGSRSATYGSSGLGLTSNISTSSDAQTALTQIKSAISIVSQWRGVLGAQQNRLRNSISIINTQAINTRAAESIIRDANMAQEMVNLTKWQILLQSGMASLTQANASSQMVLALFR